MLDASISLLLSLLQTIPAIYSSTAIEQWVGKEYTEMMHEQCSGSAAMLVESHSGQEYVMLICQQPTRSYLVLQKLVGYADTQKAILKTIYMLPLPRLGKGEWSTHQGCAAKGLNQPITAIVRDVGQPIYQTVMAWKVNLQKERFEAIDPQTVICQNPEL